ncbi:MAG: hypothetical protein ABL984_00285 [Pyrinomonadaceae bacterium]
MATTYTFTDTALDRARRLLGDTGVDGSTFLLQDAEINAEIATYRFNEAVAVLADGLATRFAQFPDETETPGGHTVKWKERVKAWQELAKRLRATNGPGTRRGAKLGSLTNPTESNIR